jgi:small GTP-binding protein
MGCGRSLDSEDKSGEINVRRKKGVATQMKLVLLGNSGVGKSSIVSRYIRKKFSDSVEATVGVGYYHHKVRLSDGSLLDLDIWDTGGQERYRALIPLYYREAVAAIICYDVSNYTTFEECEYWYRELKQTEPYCLLYLVGNKSDIPAKRVDGRFAEDYAKARNMQWTETSAKSGSGVQELFQMITEGILTKRLQENQSEP